MPWTPYKLGKKSESPKWINPDCQLLNNVSHVVHLETAERILKDGKIKSNLISTSSSLVVKNTSVSWFSPNTWSHGSRYGNVEFVFDFAKLIEGKRIYWAGVKDYGVKACCFLVTQRKLDKEYTRYDPSNDIGPWQYFLDEEEYYWNGNITLEFMFEEEISIKNCKDIHFVSHHSKYCNINASKCKDKGMDNLESGKRFIANIVAKDLPLEDHFFANFKGQAKYSLSYIFKRLLRLTADFSCVGEVKSKDHNAEAVLRAAFNFYHLDEIENFEAIAGLFKSKKDFKDSVHNLICKKFQITDKDSLYD